MGICYVALRDRNQENVDLEGGVPLVGNQRVCGIQTGCANDGPTLRAVMIYISKPLFGVDAVAIC